MRVLVIGSGGREHALVWKLRQSPRVSKIYCAPGNGGICEEAQCVAADIRNLDSLVEVATQLKPDLTVVGPELPLTLGLVDEFNRRSGCLRAWDGGEWVAFGHCNNSSGSSGN